MNGHFGQLRDLQNRVRRGDRAAAGELRQVLEPPLLNLVRRTLRLEASDSPLEKRIRVELGRLTVPGHGRPVSENPHVVRKIARKICIDVIDRLRAHPGDSQELRDTLRSWSE